MTHTLTMVSDGRDFVPADCIRKGNLREPEKWPELQDLLIQTMIRFDKVFRARVQRVKP